MARRWALAIGVLLIMVGLGGARVATSRAEEGRLATREAAAHLELFCDEFPGHRTHQLVYNMRAAATDSLVLGRGEAAASVRRLMDNMPDLEPEVRQALDIFMRALVDLTPGADSSQDPTTQASDVAQAMDRLDGWLETHCLFKP